MTNPVDDAGNPRVDFVWGNMPIQPNDQRNGSGSSTVFEPNGSQNRGWSGSKAYPSSTLSTTQTVNLSVGDQSRSSSWDDIDTRSVTVESDNHVNAIGGYEGFPAFIQGGAYDDTIPNVTVPSVVGLSTSAAQTAINNAGLDYGSTTTDVGATQGNEGKVKSQDPAGGTVVNAGSVVSIVSYHSNLVTVPDITNLAWPAANAAITNAGFTVGNTSGQTLEGATSGNTNWVATQSPAAGSQAAAGSAIDYVTYAALSTATTGPISGFNHTAGGTLWPSISTPEANMFVTGHDTWPIVGSTITVTGSSNASFNTSYTVTAVKFDDSYNTGGTAIRVQRVDGQGFTGGGVSSGGTWSYPPAAVIAPTNNWHMYNPGSQIVVDFPGVTSGMEAVIANPSAYKVVVTGGNASGEGVLSSAVMDGMQGFFIARTTTIFSNNMDLGSPSGVNGAGRPGGTDAGMASIVAI